MRRVLVLSNHALGPANELLVSPPVAAAMLWETAEAARPLAQGRWEHELVLWLEDRSRRLGCDGSPYLAELDVSEIAWTPEHFDRQRRFVVSAIDRASVGSMYARALERWSRMVALHPHESVVVGRRWRWFDHSPIY
jgi:hypothetical protein